MHHHTSLQIRSGIFYYRKRLPDDIAQMLDKQEIVRSLRTGCESVAAERSRLAGITLGRAIALLRDAEPEHVDTARALFRSWFDRLLDRNFRQLTSDRRGTIDRAKYPNGGLESAQWRNDQALGRSKLESEARYIAELIREDTSANTDLDYLSNLISHGLRELRENIFPQRREGNFADEINDRVVREALEPIKAERVVASATPSEETGPALKDAIDGFLKEHAPTLRDKTLREYDQTFRLAQDHWGVDCPVTSIDKASARDFKGLLLKLPTNMTQRFPGKTLQQAVQECEAAGLPTISAKTINKKISNVSTLFNWLVDQGYVEANPFSGLTVKEPPSRSLRDPFNADHLKKIFSNGAFSDGHQSRGSGASWQVLENFWLPLIALHTGMRLGEVAGLQAQDLREVHGVWIFDVHEHGDKQLKTASSKRQVPIHDTLIHLGLLKYHQSVADAGHVRLFPDMKSASDGYESSAFSKRFGRYLQRCSVKTDKRLVFHSFRHTIKDLMREAGIDGSVQNAICGHDDGSVQASYGSGYSPKRLHEELHKVEYPINLENLIPVLRKN